MSLWLGEPLTSHNVFVIVFHQWVKLSSDLRGARNLGDALGYLWHPPGWVPRGEGMTTAEMRARAGGWQNKSLVAAGG